MRKAKVKTDEVNPSRPRSAAIYIFFYVLKVKERTHLMAEKGRAPVSPPCFHFCRWDCRKFHTSHNATPIPNCVAGLSPSCCSQKLIRWVYPVWHDENDPRDLNFHGDDRGVVHGVASSTALLEDIETVETVEVRSRVVLEERWTSCSWGDEGRLVPGRLLPERLRGELVWDRESHWEMRERVEDPSVVDGGDGKGLLSRSLWKLAWDWWCAGGVLQTTDCDESWRDWGSGYCWGRSSAGSPWLEMGDRSENLREISEDGFSSGIVPHSGNWRSIFSLSSRWVRRRRLCSLARR